MTQQVSESPSLLRARFFQDLHHLHKTAFLRELQRSLTVSIGKQRAQRIHTEPLKGSN